MAYRLLSRTKSLAKQTIHEHGFAPLLSMYHLRFLQITRPCNRTASAPTAMQLLCGPSPFSAAFCKNMHNAHNTSTKEETKNTESRTGGSHHVLATSPLESTVMKEHKRALDAESLKTRRFAQSKKITYALIPALILMSKSNLLTSLMVVSVYWQIYGFFKEIFQDYIHHELTRKWVLTYFAVLLIILVKDTLVYYDLV